MSDDAPEPANPANSDKDLLDQIVARLVDKKDVYSLAFSTILDAKISSKNKLLLEEIKNEVNIKVEDARSEVYKSIYNSVRSKISFIGFGAIISVLGFLCLIAFKWTQHDKIAQEIVYLLSSGNSDTPLAKKLAEADVSITEKIEEFNTDSKTISEIIIDLRVKLGTNEDLFDYLKNLGNLKEETDKKLLNIEQQLDVAIKSVNYLKSFQEQINFLITGKIEEIPEAVKSELNDAVQGLIPSSLVFVSKTECESGYKQEYVFSRNLPEHEGDKFVLIYVCSANPGTQGKKVIR